MKRIPADLDSLMWTIAESGDLAAADDFERRFPDLRGELAGRLATVRGLRHGKPATTERPVPRFVPSAPAAPRRPLWPVAALGSLAAVALASYAYVALRPAPVPAPKAVTPPVERREPIVVPNEGRQPSKGTDDPMPDLGTTKAPTQPTSPPALAPMPWDKRQDVTIEEAPLSDVLNLIATTCKLQLELAPGMPNPTITANFTQKTGMEMLKELGREHKFTPLYQGNGQVLLVPTQVFTDPE